MSNPLVSIIIPSFNRAKLIRETLDSLLSQTYLYWEAIVVDDGSIDNSLQVVTSYCRKDERIKLFQRDREPKNASVCRNIGIEKSKGKYLIFLDSDDLLMPHCLTDRVQYMENYPELDFAVFQMESFDEHGIIPNSKNVHKKDNYLYAYLRHDLPWATTCPFWKTDFVKEKLLGYNEQYPRLQDPEFNTRALLSDGVKFDVLHELEADCLCRNHTAKTFNSQILITGFMLYIAEFLEKVESRNDSIECKSQLKYCTIEAFRSYYTYKGPEYDKETIKLLKQLLDNAYNQKIITFKTILFARCLLIQYRLRINKIPLGKYLLRTNMKLLKTIHK